MWEHSLVVLGSTERLLKVNIVSLSTSVFLFLCSHPFLPLSLSRSLPALKHLSEWAAQGSHCVTLSTSQPKTHCVSRRAFEPVEILLTQLLLCWDYKAMLSDQLTSSLKCTFLFFSCLFFLDISLFPLEIWQCPLNSPISSVFGSKDFV